MHRPNGTFVGSINVDDTGLRFQGTSTRNQNRKIVLENDFENNKADNGFTKLPNGLIIQWGRVNLATMNNSGNTGIIQTFTLPFPNRCLSITANDRGNTILNIGIKEGDRLERNKNTHFRVWAKKNDNTWATSGEIMYTAIGF